MKNIIWVALFAILIPLTGFGADEHNHSAHKKKSHEGTSVKEGVEGLSHDLRDLLSKEMQALQKGMMSIIPAYISGNWAEIETTAGKMKSSYILKQSLSKEQMTELHSKLPHAFIKKDQRFHYLAGMLAHAAKNRKPELINFYFSEMNESCVGCHTQFATHKFPALVVKEKSEHSHN